MAHEEVQTLLLLAHAGSETPFIARLDMHHRQYIDELGCAAVEGQAKGILSYLATLGTSQAWLHHAIALNYHDFVCWMKATIIQPSHSSVEVALYHGDLKMIMMFIQLASDFIPLFRGQASYDTIRTIFHLYPDHQDALIKAAFVTKSIWFLQERLDSNCIEILSLAVATGLKELRLTPAQQSIALKIMLQQGLDEMAVKHLATTSYDNDEIYITAAATGCLHVLQQLIPPTLDVRLAALRGALEHKHVVAWLVSHIPTITPEITQLLSNN